MARTISDIFGGKGRWLAGALVALAATAGPAAAQQANSDSPWIKICNTDAQSKKTICLVTQELRTDNGQFLASIAVREVSGDKNRSMLIAVPPGMLLQPGLRVTVDKNKPDTAKYTVCFPNACYADMPAPDALIASLKKGNQLGLTVINQQAKPVSFNLSLKGFGKVYDGPAIEPAELQKQQQKLQEELQKKAEAARQKLIDEQRKATGTPAPKP
ncbi:invasion associated locus B family protein [Segnochrobactraceae bacterium EtOH-i3]